MLLREQMVTIGTPDSNVNTSAHPQSLSHTLQMRFEAIEGLQLHPQPFGTRIMHKQSIACDPEDVLSLDFEVVDGLLCCCGWMPSTAVGPASIAKRSPADNSPAATKITAIQRIDRMLGRHAQCGRLIAQTHAEHIIADMPETPRHHTARPAGNLG